MKLYKLGIFEEDNISYILDLAKATHRKSGCSYSGYDYSLHLDAVVNVGRQYLHLIESDDDKFNVLGALSCHDMIEDCGVNYNDIKSNINAEAADIVYNVTNELGKNRKEKAEKTYPKIASCRLSTFVKLCDRIANAKFSYFQNDEKGMFKKYKQEHSEFYKSLYNADHGFNDMWEELSALMLH